MAASKVSTSAISNTAIGIDMGTSFCRIALWQNGKVTVIPNELGNKMTPSCVAFRDTRRLIGEAAEEQMLVNHKNTIRSVKRLLGVEPNDKKIQEALELESYEVEEHDKQFKCNVMFKKEEKLFAPEEVTAMLLMEMKETAEAHLGGNGKVKDAVITVPSYFNQFQRQATLNAGTIAGLNVLRLINDPTAAALAYELNKDFIDVETTKKVMFYCFGGGSLSVSIVEMKNGSSFQVLSTAGDTHLGGEDFDNKLVKYCTERFERNHEKDISKDFKAKLRLKLACEKAKRKLSECDETTIFIDNLFDEIDMVTKITRTRFENLCADSFRSAMEPVQKALKIAKLSKSAITDVVLVGGSTRMPKIQTLLKDFFNGKHLNMSANMDESFVYGAAVQAAVLAKTKDAALPTVEVVDVTPYSYAFFTDENDTVEINESNRQIPFVVSDWNFTTTEDNEEQIIMEISEASTRTKIGSAIVRAPLAPARDLEVECDFKIDANGIFHVLRILDGGATEEILCAALGRQLSPEEILRMTSDAVNYKQEDDQQRMLTLARNQAEKCISNVKQAFEEGSRKATERYNRFMISIDNHELTDEAQVASQLEQMKNELTPFVPKLAELLGHQYPNVRAANPRGRPRGKGQPAAKKARPT